MNTYKISYDNEITVFCCMHAGCGSEYFSKYNLKRHVESVHMKVKNFKCLICTQLFSSKQSLKEHYYRHEGLIPFKCLTCDKTFRQASLLSLHKRIHNSEGTTSVCIKIDASEFKFEYEKIENLPDPQKICLPMIGDSRREVQLLPLPKII